MASNTDSTIHANRQLQIAVTAAAARKTRDLAEEAFSRALQLMAYSKLGPAALAEIAVCEVMAKRAARIDIEVVRAELRRQHADNPGSLAYIERITRAGYNDEKAYVWARPEPGFDGVGGPEVLPPEAMFRLALSGPVNQYMQRPGA